MALGKCGASVYLVNNRTAKVWWGKRDEPISVFGVGTGEALTVLARMGYGRAIEKRGSGIGLGRIE
jgi:hypothetical protein